MMLIQGSSWRDRLRDWGHIAAIDGAWRRFPSLNTSHSAHPIISAAQVTSNAREAALHDDDGFHSFRSFLVRASNTDLQVLDFF
jgi:hypothetical protein